MNLEELVRLVVAQVFQALKEEQNNYRALVLFTGGKTKYQEAIKEVKKLADQGWSFAFACSEGAEAIYGSELRAAFPGAEFLTNPLKQSPLELQEKMDLVLIPALSQNSLIKIALGLGDTLPTLLIKMALLLGKPILASNNAADTRYFCQQRGLSNPSPGLLELMDGYLDKVASFGIELTDVRNLAQQAEALVRGKKTELSPTIICSKSDKARSVAKKVITGEDITRAAGKGEDIYYQVGTLVTPLARDLARQHGVRLVKAEKE